MTTDYELLSEIRDGIGNGTRNTVELHRRHGHALIEYLSRKCLGDVGLACQAAAKAFDDFQGGAKGCKIKIPPGWPNSGHNVRVWLFSVAATEANRLVTRRFQAAYG